MTPEELKSARRSLGLSCEKFAQRVGVASGRTVRRWEAGDREIPGSIAIILSLIELNDDLCRLIIALDEEKE